MKLCNFEIGLNKPLFLIAGPCVIESEQMSIDIAGYLKEITQQLGINFIFKSSFDKANRTSINSFRGLGIDEGLKILSQVKKQINVPILTDVHKAEEINQVTKVVDVLQTPAFLARQTDFIKAVCQAGLPVNIKKAQFMAPEDMLKVIEKAKLAAKEKNLPDNVFMVCDRGTSFGYHNLITDMRGLKIMRQTNCPVIFDATHSVQQPSQRGDSSGGKREFVPVLARAATAVGIAGIFMETHPNPNQAKSDGPNSVPLRFMKDLLSSLIEIDKLVKNNPFLEDKIISD